MLSKKLVQKDVQNYKTDYSLFFFPQFLPAKFTTPILKDSKKLIVVYWICCCRIILASYFQINYHVCRTTLRTVLHLYFIFQPEARIHTFFQCYNLIFCLNLKLYGLGFPFRKYPYKKHSPSNTDI